MRQTRVFSFVSTKTQKPTASPESKNNRTMTKMVPAAQSGNDKIQDMLPTECDVNSKGVCKSEETKIDYFETKFEQSSAPF